MPAGALAPYPTDEGPPYPATGPDQSYLIDTDINVDDAGRLIEDELLRNDATKIGDVAIYEMCAPRRQVAFLPPPPPLGTTPPDLVGHDPDRSHFLIASHEIGMGHYRFGSHNPYWSHNRFHSHYHHWSHSRRGSHNSHWSHSRRGSHHTAMSHHTPPHGHHLVAISSRNPPHTHHKPPKTAGGSPGSQFGGACSTAHGKTTCTGSGPPPTTSGKSGSPGTEYGGTCSTVGGKTTCTGTGPPSSSGTQSQTGHHNAAISRQGSSHTSGQGSTTSSHTTSHTTKTTSHTTTWTSHTSHASGHTRRVSTSHGGRSASYSHRSRGGGGGYRSGGRGFGGGYRGGGFRGGGGGRGRHSDIRLKQDIALLARLDNGIGIYRFRYRSGDPTLYVGEIAQEVQQVAPSAVTRGSDGYLRVRYERIGVPFMTWAAWLKAHRPADRNDAVDFDVHGP